MRTTVRTAGRTAGTLVALALAAAGCSLGGGGGLPGPGEPAVPETVTPVPETVTPVPETVTPPAETETVASVVASGLEAPWGIAFAPDGTAFVSERDSGRIVSIDAAGTVTEVATVAADGSNEGGLLGIAVSPDFAADNLVYAYFTTAQDNRIVRFTPGGEPEQILTGIPAEEIHNGGRIAFGPDGMLYAGTGDATAASSAQDPASLAGKILRMTPDGEVPADNPTPGSLVYSLGHRNVQGLAWDAAGQLYASELGQNTFDEVNLITAGGNYGWPEVEGVGAMEGFVDPIATFTTEEASPSGVAFLTDGAMPQFEGDLFVAALRGQQLWRLSFAEDGSVAEREALLAGEFGRLRAVEQAPDGSLWILTSNLDGRGEEPADGLGDRVIRLGPPTPAAPAP